MIDIERLASEIKRRKAKKVLVQIPEGLKMSALGLLDELKKHGINTLLSTETCYGACDLKDREAKALGCDLLVHIGHSDMGVKTVVPVIYEEYRMDLNPVPLLKNNISALKPYKKICLITTLQFIDSLEKAKKFLQSAAGGKKKVFIGNPNTARYPGQILGCDFSAALPFQNMTDCFLFIGSGFFHPLGLAMKVERSVLFLDVETGKLRDMADEKRRREIIRTANVHKARDCQNFGVLVSTKQGQMNIRTAETVRTRLKKKGKHAWIVVMNELEPRKLMGMKFDCLVNCACPRLTNDSAMFRKPIINPDDVDRL
jgi:2-(3-amino-3-carboxypropyl)histidine synthase